MNENGLIQAFYTRRISMSTLDSKQINVNGTIFSFAQLANNPDKYVPLFSSIFRTSTMNQKADESKKEYLKRLFRLAFYTKHLAVTADTQVTTDNASTDENALQQYQDIRYNRLYIADVDDLFVCNLDDGLKDDSRLLRYRITQEQRQAFYQEAVQRQTIRP